MTCDDLSHFVRVASKLLQADDVASSTATLAETWSCAQLIEALNSTHDDAVLLSAISLGLIGSEQEAPALVARLGHHDASIVAACEDALWSIWVRSAGSSHVNQLHQAMHVARESDWEQALPLLSDLIESRPDYAEARHQYAIAHHALGNAAVARDAYQKTLELNPLHYPARCALGHLAVEANEFRNALREYEAALAIHPQLEVRELVPQLSQAIAKRIVA